MLHGGPKWQCTRTRQPKMMVSRRAAACIINIILSFFFINRCVGFSSSSVSNKVTNSDNDFDRIHHLTEVAIYRCGSGEGLDALRVLKQFCDRRLPYDFDVVVDDDKDDDDPCHSHCTECKNNTKATDRGERIISFLPDFLPIKTINNFLESVRYMEAQNYLSMNKDSVDNLPSLHLNLVSHGKPMFDDDDPSSFGSQLYRLYKIVRPYVYNTLLPAVNRLLNENNNNVNASTTKRKNLRVSDIFLRRYGEDICGNVTRNGISVHYDVFSRITAVVALDDVASKGDNGLFTLSGRTSNHKALRQYFPLNMGDCVVHTWDVLHGVDVERGLDRTSLIVWFDEEPIYKNTTTNEKKKKNINNTDDVSNTKNQDNEKFLSVSPWLLLENRNHNLTSMNDGNDVRQFVLASALASMEDTSIENGTNSNDEIWLYLRSAAQGNTFALTRIGSLFEEGSVSCIDIENEAFAILEQFTSFQNLPTIIQDMFRSDDDDDNCLELACRFWLEASLRGNPLAQKALADEVMFIASQSKNEKQRLLAAVLFALASQQDDQEASESLARVVQYDIAARDVSTREEFLASPIIQIANAALNT